ncbi:MAG TPA: hypothetical protein VF074_19685 [Pyrinomonadaceae bacterium]
MTWLRIIGVVENVVASLMADLGRNHTICYAEMICTESENPNAERLNHLILPNLQRGKLHFSFTPGFSPGTSVPE